MNEPAKRPKFRKLPLFTRGDIPELDSLKICCDLLNELEPRMRAANLQYIADKFGYRLFPKATQ